MIDVRQSKNYANYLSTLGWTVETIAGVNYFIKKIPIIGSVLKIQRPERIDFDRILALTKKYRVFQIIIEPKDNSQEAKLKNQGFKLSKNPYLPSKTLQIDLAKSINHVVQNFKKDARKAIRVGEKFSIKEYSSPSEIKLFREAWKKSVSFRRFVPPTDQLIDLRKNFPDNYSLFLASHNNFGTIIGGAIFTRSSHGNVYYWQAFTNKEGRSSLSQYSLLYQGILWAKKQGCKVFDFEGIYDPRFPNKSWLGFTHFKKSFGGYEVEYPGCYIKTYLPL